VPDQLADIVLERHDAEQARTLSDLLCQIYREAYVGTDREHDPFYSAERFLERFDSYSRAPGFEFVLARSPRSAGDEVAGYAFGYTLPERSRWWSGMIDQLPAGFAAETGQRTFAVIELHVREVWQGRGVASRLHRELLTSRTEQRATLLVRQDNPARAVYERWGYRSVGRQQPYPDSPVYEVLVLELPD
jgi:ribosomal protein S18 acetylase RimI-like enzyme